MLARWYPREGNRGRGAPRAPAFLFPGALRFATLRSCFPTDHACWSKLEIPKMECIPPPCISYANVHIYYGPYAYCGLDKNVACAQHIQLPTHTCAGHMC